MTLLKDKNGKEIPVQSVICGQLKDQTEKHYFNFGLNSKGNEYEMMACTYGYVHNVTQADIADFEYIGSLKENLHLLACD